MDLTGLYPILFARGRVRGEVRDEGKGEAQKSQAKIPRLKPRVIKEGGYG